VKYKIKNQFLQQRRYISFKQNYRSLRKL